MLALSASWGRLDTTLLESSRSEMLLLDKDDDAIIS
jgi:hypothetical protein